MANTNTPYIAKNAAPLLNPVAATVFTTPPSAIATVAATQQVKPAYVRYAVYAQGASGTSNNINYVKVAVRAGGRVTAAAGNTTTFVPALVIYSGGAVNVVPPTVASVFAQLGALNSPTYTVGGQWTLDATLVWDYASGLVSGTFNGNQTNAAGQVTITASQAVVPATGYTVVPPLTTLPTTAAQAAAQVNNGGEGQLFFGVTGLFGTGATGNIAYLDDFEVEVL